MSQITSTARFARFPRFVRPLTFAALPVGGLIAVGCFTGADLQNPERFQINTTGYEHAGCFETIVYNSCSGGICHTGEAGGDPPGGGIDLSSPGYAARLYNQPAQYGGVAPSASCPPATAEKFIDPAGLSASFLWKKVSPGSTICGEAMPIGSPLEAADLDCVRAFTEEVIANPPAPEVGTGGSASGGGSAVGGGAAVGGGSSGGGPASGGSGSGGAPGCDVTTVLKGCSSTSCHGKEDGSKPPTYSDLDLYAPGLEARIYNQPTTYKGVDQSVAANPAACPSPAQLLVDPKGLDTSLMWMKVINTHSCGDVMPSSGTFDANETACYKSWLEGLIANGPKQ